MPDGGPRPIASLSSGLLARKGEARPAMRPHRLDDPCAPSPDDLGWNDMGAARPPTDPAGLPPVLVERAALSDEVARVVPAATPRVDPAVIERIGRAGTRPGHAAFTLRLPADRHLRLRLAAAVTHRSAQAIVTSALDALLSTLPEVEELARRCSAPDRPTSDQMGNRP